MSYPKVICPCCLRKVLDSEKGICCDHKCDRWFHFECSGLTESEYLAYSGNTRKKWRCNRADCSSVEENPISKLSDQMAELLKTVSQLASKSEIKEINDNISSLKNSIDNRLDDIDCRLTHLEEKVIRMEDSNSQSPSSVGLEGIVQEIGDRSRRVCNVIIYNVIENASKDVKKRIDHDKGILNEMGRVIDYSFDFNTVKLYRIGKPKKDKIRPLKLVFRTQNEATECIKKFISGNLKESNSNFSDISISRDKTDRERQHLKNLREELEKRLKNGESNLTIKYRNGVPEIVQSKNV